MTNKPSDDVPAQLTDSCREDLSVAAIRVITQDVADLVALRGRVSSAIIVLEQHGNIPAALAILRGEVLS